MFYIFALKLLLGRRLKCFTIQLTKVYSNVEKASVAILSFHRFYVKGFFSEKFEEHTKSAFTIFFREWKPLKMMFTNRQQLLEYLDCLLVLFNSIRLTGKFRSQSHASVTWIIHYFLFLILTWLHSLFTLYCTVFHCKLLALAYGFSLIKTAFLFC